MAKWLAAAIVASALPVGITIVLIQRSPSASESLSASDARLAQYLEDGVLSVEEHDDAVYATIACMEDAGALVQAVERDYWGLLQFVYSAPQSSEFEASINKAQRCEEQILFPVAQVLAQQRANPAEADRMSERLTLVLSMPDGWLDSRMEHCLRDEGLIALGETLEDLGDSIEASGALLSPPEFDGCFNRIVLGEFD